MQVLNDMREFWLSGKEKKEKRCKEKLPKNRFKYVPFKGKCIEPCACYRGIF